ncbi:serine hydrolase domain-containing protein [Fusibacter bizertensis]
MKKWIQIALLILAFLVTMPTFAAVDADEMTQKINVEMINYNVPGAVIAVVKDGKLYYKNAFGEANIYANTPMNTESTIVQTGSISKVLTAYALLNLLDEKKIDVDTAIMTYLPEYLKDNRYISSLTFRNLLTHTTGLAMLKAESATMEDPIKSISLSFGEQAETFFDKYKLDPIIEKDNYTIFSNVGYILSGALIESISGERYEYYMAKKVLEELDMNLSSNILLNKGLEGTTLLQGYSVYGGQRTPMSPFKTKYLASDDFLTSTDDMTQLMMFLTSKKLPQNIYDAMFTRQVSNNALVSGRSFGFTVVHFGKYDAYLHDGGIPGSNSRLLFIPDLKVGLFISYNSNDLKARDSITNVVLSSLIEDLDQKESYSPFTIGDLSKFDGAYSPINASNETLEKLTRIIHQIRISHTTDGLKISGDTYNAISETVFYSEASDNYAEFKTDSKGQLEYLVIGNTIYERTPFFQSIILETTLLVLMAICNLVALLILIFRWNKMKVNRIHDTPRFVLLLHSLSISGILIFVFIISTSYDIWDIIYGMNTAVKGTRFFGIATLLLSIPALIMINRTKQDFRWSSFMVGVYQLQFILGVFLVIWMFGYHLI